MVLVRGRRRQFRITDLAGKKIKNGFSSAEAALLWALSQEYQVLLK